MLLNRPTTRIVATVVTGIRELRMLRSIVGPILRIISTSRCFHVSVLVLTILRLGVVVLRPVVVRHLLYENRHRYASP